MLNIQEYVLMVDVDVVIYTLYSVGASICAAALSAWSLPPEEFSQRLDGTCPSSQSH